MLNDNRLNLIFDFDGTLVDSFAAAVYKFNSLADEYNFCRVNETEIAALKNFTSRELIRQLKIPVYKLPGILSQAREYMRSVMPSLASFTDLPEVLAELHESGFFLGILTSNSLDNVTSWLEQNNMQHFFHLIHAESSYFGKKHNLKKIIKEHGMDLLRTFYIGDETRDVEAAHKCRIHSIAVTWGFNSQQSLELSIPDYIAKKPTDLLRIVDVIVSKNQ